MLENENKKWDYAIGLAKVSGTNPSPEFLKMFEQEKKGELTTKDMLERLKQRYGIKIIHL